MVQEPFPVGTPDITLVGLLLQPFTITCCDLPLGKFSIQNRVPPQIPLCESLRQTDKDGGVGLCRMPC